MTDIAGNSSTTATLSLGGSVTSSIDTLGDHDWYSITLIAGQAVTVTIDGVTLEDSFLNIRDSSGNILFSNDDVIDGEIRGSKVTFTPSYTGTYYVDAGAFSDQYTGAYTVSAQPYPAPPASYDQIAKQLTTNYWEGDTHHWNVTQGGTISVNISTLTAAEKTLARAALQEWTDIIGVHFQEVTTGGQISFSDAEDTTAGGPIAQTSANWTSNGIITSANVQISSSWVNNYGTGLNTYSFQTYIHEIGHALGLGHAGDYNSTATYPNDTSFANDAWSTTIMSYFDQQESSYFANQGFSRLYVMTPMDGDVVAMQSLYGLSTTTRTGDTTYGDNATAGGVFDAVAYPRAAFAIFDSGGNDTIDYSRVGVAQLINLNAETFSNVNGFTGNLTIARGTIIENAIGGSAADTIIGNSANNVLTGNSGSDTLTGGGGIDIFRDTKAGHSGDKITDFGAGDQIIFTDAALAGFTYSLSGNTLTYSGGSLTLQGTISGTWSVTAAASGGVDLMLSATATATPLHVAVHNDFNGDGRSDVLVRSDSGIVNEWLGQSDGSLITNNAVSSNLSSDWHVVGTGDFNGDSRSDVLFQNDNGTITDWLGRADGTFTGNGANFSINPGTQWHFVGAGDFNGDGRSDFLLRNDSGTLNEWLGQANGGFSANGALNTTVSSAWQIAGTADFNGDGRVDVLLRNSDGTVSDWLARADGTFAGNAGTFNANVGTQWHVVATGDFNGDHLADVLLRNDSGLVSEWLGQASGSFVSNPYVSNSVSSAWHVAGTGDINGDGRDDVIWQNIDGTTTDWLGRADGSFAGNSGHFNINVGTQWHVQDPFVHDPFQ